MKKGLTELVFILDRSGSMRGLEQDTIGGFNGMIDRQRREAGEVLVSAVLFDDKREVIYDRINIRSIHEMTEKEYYVGGCTALLDAVGYAIHHIENVRYRMNSEEKPEKTIFIITTDGMENASRDYTYEKVKHMIEKQQKNNWEFIFLGANIDAAGEAARMGIRSSRAVNYNCDAEGTALNYEVLNKTVSKMRKCKSASEMSVLLDKDECFEEIRKDYETRGRKS